MRNEDPDHRNRCHPVDVAGSLKTSKEPREKSRPTRVCELERHSCQRQAHEAYDHDNVKYPIQSLEPKKLLLGSRTLNL